MAEKQNQQSSALVACMHAKGSLSNYFQDYIHTYTYIIIQKAARRVKPCLSSQSDLLGGLLGSLF